MTQYTGILHNKADLVHCRSCATPLLFIYSRDIREFCAECEAMAELEAFNEAKRIIRNRRR